MKKGHISDIIKTSSSLLRAGDVSAARNELMKVKGQKVPRKDIVGICQLSRQLGIPMFGLRLLSPIVRDERRGGMKAELLEIVTYAALLIKIGGTEEALELLKTVKEDRDDVLLYSGFAEIGRWEYGKAIPFLEKYLASSTLTPVERIVGELNLAASLIFERNTAQARKILSTLEIRCREEKYNRFLGNTMELLAQVAFLEKKWIEATHFLLEAEGLLKDTATYDRLFVKKWRSLVDLHQSTQPFSFSALEEVRREAVQANHWETVRDSDRWIALLKRDVPLLTRVLYGTPFKSFKNQILREVSFPFECPKVYDWVPFNGNPSEKNLLNLISGELNGKQFVKPGQSLHRLLVGLFSDFYRPFRIITLHHAIYPNEYFNPHTSPFRVHQLMIRLRRLFNENKISDKIEPIGGSFRVVPKGSIAIRISQDVTLQNSTDALLVALKNQTTSRSFTSSETGNVLRLSERSARRVLSEGVRSGKLIRTRKAKETLYKFAS